MQGDRNFDDMTRRFAQNIYGTTKGQIRQAIVWQDLETILVSFPADKVLTILDVGGGQGQIALKLAQLGHRVTICDISQQMLEVAKHSALAQGLQLQYIHCAAQALPQHLEQQTFDLVICHAVLEWVSEPVELIAILKRYLDVNGILSLMFYNYHGLLFRTITLGNLGYVSSGLNKRKKKTLSPDYPRKPEEVYQWLADASFTIINKTGVRVFHDYLQDKSKQQSRFDTLLQLEQQYCQQEPYLSLGRYIHITARLEMQADSS